MIGIPADVTSLPAGAGTVEGTLPPGAVMLANDYGTRDFGGAAPPQGDGPHRYIFMVLALDTDETGLDAGTSFAKAQFATLDHVVARGAITGTYEL